MTKTKDMISIHHASGSWQDEALQKCWWQLQDEHCREDAIYALKHVPNHAAIKVLGEEKYERLKDILKVKSKNGG